jgi:hypothetical protein
MTLSRPSDEEDRTRPDDGVSGWLGHPPAVIYEILDIQAHTHTLDCLHAVRE